MVLISTFVQIERRLFLSKFFPVVVVSLIFPVVKNMNEVRSAVWRVGLGCQLKSHVVPISMAIAKSVR